MRREAGDAVCRRAGKGCARSVARAFLIAKGFFLAVISLFRGGRRGRMSCLLKGRDGDGSFYFGIMRVATMSQLD